MSARAGDVIHLNWTFGQLPGQLHHLCSCPEAYGTRSRMHLDPCATGLCRYCKGPLPVSPDKEKVASS